MSGASLPRVTVAAIAERDGRFLLVEEWDHGRLVLNQPAGHLEIGESLTDAVRREMLEETGWGFEPSHLVGVYRYANGAGIGYVRFVFSGALSGHDPERPLDPDIRQVFWLAAAEIRAAHARLRGPQVLAGLNDYLAGRRFPLSLLRDLTLSETQPLALSARTS